MSLSDKVSSQAFIVIDQIALEQPKTKEFVKILSGLSAIKNFGKKQLLVMPKKDDKLSRCTSNLKSITPILANSLNLVDVLTADSILVLKDSLPVIEKTYLKLKNK